MSELTSTLKVVIDGSGAKSGAAQVSSAVNSMAQSAGSSVDKLSIKITTFNDKLKQVQQSSFNWMKALVSTAAIAGFTHSLINANREFAAFIAISKVSRGSIEGAMESFENIKNISNTLGTSLEHNIKSFGKFEAAMRPIDKTGQLTQHIFEALSIASSGLHLTSLQLELSFKAIEQAASKNKPTLEEFQRQLAEHIPGAMAYLAEGVGLRMDEIHNAISKGTISIRDLLTGFANVLKQKFGDAAEYAAKQLPAALERMRNAIFLFNVEIGRAGAAEALNEISKAVVELVGKTQVSSAIGEMFKDIGLQIANFIRLITPQDINNLQKALQMIVTLLVEFIKNIRLIFEMVAFGIIGKYLGIIITSILKTRTAAIAAGSGIKVFTMAMIGLRTALGGPGGVVALLVTLIPLLAKLGRDDDADKQEMSIINKQRQLAAYDKSIKATSAQIAAVGNSNLPIEQKIASINGIYAITEKLKASREKLFNELSNKSEEDLSLQALLGSMQLPGDTPINSDKDKTKDPLKKYLDDTSIEKMKEYYRLTGLLNARFSNGDPTKLSREQFALWAETYRKINDEFLIDVFDNGKFKTFDSDVAEMIRTQQDNVNDLNSDLYDASEELKDMRKDYSRDLRDTTDELFGNIFQSKFSEISDWLLDETEKFDKMQLSPKVRHDLTEMINAIADAKYKLAELEGVREFFGASEDVVSSAEQSLQSRVIAGLISESDARMKLRHVIGEQGKMLETKLLPVIKAILKYTTDEKTLTEMQAIIDKIQEMVNIGKQTNFLEGWLYGLNEYATASVDAFTMAKDAALNAFKSMEDALVEFVMTGKMEFGSFIDSILSDISRMLIQQNITKPLASMLSGFSSSDTGMGLLGGLFDLFSAKGNVFSSGSVKAFASGGILGPNGGLLTAPTIFPMANGGLGVGGEAGTEAIMPVKRLPNGQMGVSAEIGSTSAPNVIVNIVESPGNGGQTQDRMEGNTRILDVMVEQIKAAVGSDIAHGGTVASAMERTYGLNRAAGAF